MEWNGDEWGKKSCEISLFYLISLLCGLHTQIGCCNKNGAIENGLFLESEVNFLLSYILSAKSSIFLMLFALPIHSI